MEAKSEVVSVRFSAEEFEKINGYMKKYGMKCASDLVHISTGFLISFVDAMEKIVTSEKINEGIEKFNSEFRAELDKVPKNEAKLRDKFQDFENEVLSNIEAELQNGVIHVEPFVKRRSTGRPKTPKRKPGERKSLGYND